MCKNVYNRYIVFSDYVRRLCELPRPIVIRAMKRSAK